MTANMSETKSSREQEARQNIRKAFVLALADCGHIIAPAAIALAPVRTGKYKASIGYAVTDEKNMQAALFAGNSAVRYAHIIEFGSHKMAPRAPLRKAGEQTQEKMGQIVIKRMAERDI